MTDRMANCRDLIATWLAVSADHQIFLGLPREEAKARARDLLTAFRDGIQGTQLLAVGEESEELKDVACSLVALLPDERFESPDTQLKVTTAAYDFISSLSWDPDDFAERHELLRACAKLGWRSLQTSLSEIEQGRRNPRDGRAAGCGIPLSESRSSLPSGRRSGRNIDIAEYALQCRDLLDQMNTNPASTADEAAKLYRVLGGSNVQCGVFDERDYFLGLAARLVAGGLRHLARFDDARRWLQRAARFFSRTTDPQSLLVKLECEEIAILHDERQHHQVIASAPLLADQASALGMDRDKIKCRVLEASSLKQIGLLDRAFEQFSSLAGDTCLRSFPEYHPIVLMNLGELLAVRGEFSGAEAFLQTAWSYAKDCDLPLNRGNLLAELGQIQRLHGDLDAAVASYSGAVTQGAALGLERWVAYCRILLAETLIASARFHDAEREIALALPTIEKHGLMLERVAVESMLRYSLETRGVDPDVVWRLKRRLGTLLS